MATALTTTSPLGARARASTYQVVLAVLVIAFPVASTLAVADATTFTTAMQLFTTMLSGSLPLLFPVIVACFGCLTLTWRLSHGFVALTAVRTSIRADLARRALANAALVGAIFFSTVVVAAVVAFEVVSRAQLITFRPESMLTYPEGLPFSPAQVRRSDLSNNTWSFLYAAGWPVYAVIYGAFVALAAAAWSSLCFLLVLVVANRYLALSVPFIVCEVANFLAALAGHPEFSPLSSVFPFNITAQPLWTAFVPVGVVIVATAALATWCWRNVDRLESLS